MTRDQSFYDDYSIMAQLTELIGHRAAMSLCAAFGGTEVYIPNRLTNDHRIVKAIGLEAARKLADYTGNGQGSGGRLEVPRGISISLAQRNHAIRAELAKGLSKTQLALRYGLTTRRVRQICNETDEQGETDAQGSFFTPPQS